MSTVKERTNSKKVNLNDNIMSLPSIPVSSSFQTLRQLIKGRTARVGICGMGYVGLPLAVAVGRAGFPVIGLDVDKRKIEKLSGGVSYIEAVPSVEIGKLHIAKKFQATTDFSRLAECDVIVICVPTPLTAHREPDLSCVRKTTKTIARHLRPGQLVVLESTTFPGTTDEIVIPILENWPLRSRPLKAGHDFFVGFSPEREDPGNRDFGTCSIPKILSGDGPEAVELVRAFYGSVVDKVVAVSSNKTAEAVKLTENIFRAVNIGLVNELKVVYDAMGIDIWEVIDAAKTKPFGFMPFYPGPGLGGHCIPIDPFYLTWKSREYGLSTRFIELAGEINVAMPSHVVGKLEAALNRRLAKALSVSKILLVGMSYKKNVPDIRESPSLKLMQLLEAKGAIVDFHDPHVSGTAETRHCSLLAGRRSVELHEGTFANYDAALIAVDHDEVDYSSLSGFPLVVDTRNVCSRHGFSWDTIVKA